MSQSYVNPEGNRLAMARFVAKQMAKNGKVDERELSEAVAEIELESQINAAPFIKVQLIDPEWKLVNSGFISVNEEILNKVEVEFPEGSGWHWELVNVEITNDLTGPNLVLTLEDNLVTFLREQHGYKTVPKGTKTRAQFEQSMIQEANQVRKKEGRTPIRLVCPSVNEVQPLEVTQESEEDERKQQIVKTNQQKLQEQKKANRSAGISAVAKLTVGGVPISSSQREICEEAIGIAERMGAPAVAVEAMIFAAIAESKISAQADNGTYWGVWSGSHTNFPDAKNETAQQAESFLKGGKGFNSAIDLVRGGNNSPIEVAVAAEGVPIQQYEEENGFNNFLTEAKAIINAAGGGQPAAAEGSGGVNLVSDVSQLTRGTPEEPDESTWDALVRLNEQVRWFVFTSGYSITKPENGRFLYILDGYDLIKQKPRAHINLKKNTVADGFTGVVQEDVIVEGLVGNFDNTTWENTATKKEKKGGKTVRLSKRQKPATPTELQIPITCGPFDYQAGDVFILEEAGPLNGRWVVQHATRNCIGDTFTNLTLAPPLLPYPEPIVPEEQPGEGSAGLANTGELAGAVEAAKKAYKERSKYQYSEGSDRGNGGTLFGPTPRTMDCSAFCTLCYKEGDLPDPSQVGYNPIGYTGSMIANMVETKNPQPGDLLFFGERTVPYHVVMYIGGNEAIGMESTALGIVKGDAWGERALGQVGDEPIGGRGVAFTLKKGVH